MRKYWYLLAIPAALWFGACEDPLEVKNFNNPNADDVLATPADLQNWIRDTFNAWFTGIGVDVAKPQMYTGGLENHSELANFNMGPRYLIPRNFIENSRGAAGSVNSDFLRFHRAARSAALGLAKLRAVTIGTPGLDAQARAFAWFSLGLSNGYLSLVWDSAAVASPDDDLGCTALECLSQLVSYQVVNAAAIQNLDSALAIANANPGAFPIPSTWLRQAAGMSQADFIKVVRSYRAQIRAGVARTPAERAALDWGAIIADAEAGITADFQLDLDPANNWNLTWPQNQFRPGSWHAMHMFMIGPADTTGLFEPWLNTPRASKVQFLIQTPDRRFPVGATRAGQQSLPTGASVLPEGQYFRNRPPGEDTSGDALGNSMYDHYRFRAFFNANRIGPYPILTKAEIDLLAAEGYIRANQLENARLKINWTRTAAGLPEIPAGVTINDPVPGGVGCVPRVPSWSGSAYQALCGNIMEAMKWEKRMETAYTGYGNWFIDSRGWGDLPEGTPLDWPVPWEEKDTRRADFVTVWGGCVRLASGESAGPSTYGPAISCAPTP